MSIRRVTLFSVLLALMSSHALADSVLVNTGDDENGTNGEKCSIREAVAFLAQKNTLNAYLTPVKTALTEKQSVLNNLKEERKVKVAELQSATLKSKIDALKAQLLQIDRDIAALNAVITLLTNSKSTLEAQILALQVSGCKPQAEGGEDVILLSPKVDEFMITRGEITIGQTLTIERDDTTLGDGAIVDSSVTDKLARTKLRVSGKSRMFTLDDGNADTKVFKTVKLVNLDLAGCSTTAAPQDCADKGGVIFNKEFLSLENVYLHNGQAFSSGGGIYNDMHGALKIARSTLWGNTAPQGAAVTSAFLDLYILESLFHDNVETTSNGATVKILLDAVTDASVQSQQLVENTTFGKNEATAISVWDLRPKNPGDTSDPSPNDGQLKFRNLTLVENKGGIDFNGKPIILHNSIIAGNGVRDCLNAPAAMPSANFHHNFTGSTCPAGQKNTSYDPPANPADPLDPKAANKLIADLVNGKCATPPALGLLCPLADNGGKTESYKPRLLSTYSAISDSPIVNQGDLPSSSSTAMTCSSGDQRGTSRSLCDIGAVELESLNVSDHGIDAKMGDTLHISLLEKIGDGELMPYSWCVAQGISGAIPGMDGCVVIETPSAKGNLVFNNTTHEIVYTPVTGYHGVDRFTYSISTTLSHFSDAVNDKTLSVNVTIVADPAGTMRSKSFAGATGILVLAGLAGLVALRRKLSGE